MNSGCNKSFPACFFFQMNISCCLFIIYASQKHVNDKNAKGLWKIFNTLPHMQMLGFSNSAANMNMMSKRWTNGVQLSD